MQITYTQLYGFKYATITTTTTTTTTNNNNNNNKNNDNDNSSILHRINWFSQFEELWRLVYAVQLLRAVIPLV